jgi:hypothetical protein
VILVNKLEEILNNTLKEMEVENLIKTENISDGYHTFGQLYHDRAVLFAMICNTYKDKAWKSKQHDDGTMFDDMFIVGVATPHGHYTYHFHIEPYWDMYDVMEIERAPKWDGHTYKDIDRLFGLLNN